MYQNFIVEAEEVYKHKTATEEILNLQKDIQAGYFADLFEKYDWINIDTEIVLMAIELGWNKEEYLDDNTYDEESEEETEAYNNSRTYIVNAAYDYLVDALDIINCDDIYP